MVRCCFEVVNFESVPIVAHVVILVYYIECIY